MKKFFKYIVIENQKYFINDLENYCCFWIYDNYEFKKFVNSKWWNFKEKLTNFRHYYGVTERSALGLHAFNINYYKQTVLPAVENNLDKRCFVEHITNNYLYKFENNKKDSPNNIKNFGIENVCKYKIDELLETEKYQYQINFLNIIQTNLVKITWKFRFLKKFKKSIFKLFKKIG